MKTLLRKDYFKPVRPVMFMALLCQTAVPCLLQRLLLALHQKLLGAGAASDLHYLLYRMHSNG